MTPDEINKAYAQRRLFKMIEMALDLLLISDPHALRLGLKIERIEK